MSKSRLICVRPAGLVVPDLGTVAVAVGQLLPVQVAVVLGVGVAAILGGGGGGVSCDASSTFTGHRH